MILTYDYLQFEFCNVDFEVRFKIPYSAKETNITYFARFLLFASVK